MNIFLDIETIPTQNPAIVDYITKNVKTPSRMSKPETIKDWWASTSDTWGPKAAAKEEIDKSGLDGAYGEICCIGWAFDDMPAVSSSHYDDTPEKDVLDLFVRKTAAFVEHSNNRHPQIVGHNVLGFDIPFIQKRCAVHGIKLPAWWPQNTGKYSREVYDTMMRWDSNKFIGMDKLCAALGLEGKSDVDGSMVAGMFAEGKHEEIAEYCRQDVTKTREVWRKMNAAGI